MRKFLLLLLFLGVASVTFESCRENKTVADDVEDVVDDAEDAID